MFPLVVITVILVPITASLPKDEELSPYRWNLVPKQLLKKLCNLDDSLPICAWKRHHKVGGKAPYSKWQICRDHPELNICKWHNGGMITLPVPSTTTARTEDSAEAPPTGTDSIFVNEPDMMLSSKWSNAESLQETVQKELKSQHRFEGRLHGDSEETSEGVGSEKFDESIMTGNGDVFTS